MDNDHDQLGCLVANEVLRRRSEGDPCVMLLLTHIDQAVVPHMVFLEEKHLNSDVESLEPLLASNLVDEDENVLYPGKHDVVGGIVARAHALSNLDWQSLWKEKPFESLVAKEAGQI